MLGWDCISLGGFLEKVGVPNGAMDAQYRQAKSMMFSLHDILQDKVETVQLDKYVNSAYINSNARHTSDLLQASRIYIITSIIKCKKFSIEARDASGGKFSLHADQIQGAIGSNIAVSTQNSTDTNITYDSKVPLTFAFQAIQLSHNQKFHLCYKIASPRYSMRGDTNNAQAEKMLGQRPSTLSQKVHLYD